MHKKLWGIIPTWALAVVAILAIAGTALAAYILTTRDVTVTIEEPISVSPDTAQSVTLYPGQSVMFTVTNAADVEYGMLYACTVSDNTSELLARMEVDKDGPGSDNYTSHSGKTAVKIAPYGTQYLKVVCSEESAPGPGKLTITFSRKEP